MAMTPHERAKAANAALTPEQRSAAGKARAAQLHHPVTLARRIGAKWPELSDEDPARGAPRTARGGRHRLTTIIHVDVTGWGLDGYRTYIRTVARINAR
jgi:hypothetical protein